MNVFDGSITYINGEKLKFEYIGSTQGNAYIDIDVSAYVKDFYSYTWQAVNNNYSAFNGLITDISCVDIYTRIVRISLDRPAGACAFTLIARKF